jgi:hypothetical protein
MNEEKTKRLEHKHRRYMAYLQYSVTIYVAIIGSGIIFKEEAKEAISEYVSILEAVIGLTVILIGILAVIHRSLYKTEDEIYPLEIKKSTILEIAHPQRHAVENFKMQVRYIESQIEEIEKDKKIRSISIIEFYNKGQEINSVLEENKLDKEFEQLYQYFNSYNSEDRKRLNSKILDITVEDLFERFLKFAKKVRKLD